MNRNRLVAMGYAALCAVGVSATFVDQAKSEDAPSEPIVNLPVPAPGSDHEKYLEILEELGQGDHSNVPLLLEICAKHKEPSSFVRISPAMLAAMQRNYLTDQKAKRSTMAMAAVTSMRHSPTPENAWKVRKAIEDWGFGIERLGLKPGEIVFVQEHTDKQKPLRLPVVKQRVPVAAPVLASRHGVKPLVKSVAKPVLKPIVRRRQKAVPIGVARVDIRPAPPKRAINNK